MMKRILLAVFFSLSMGLVALEQAFANEAAHHIMHVLKAQFDTPENPLTVEPVSIEGDFAVAGWSQGGKGGQCIAAAGQEGCGHGGLSVGLAGQSR